MNESKCHFPFSPTIAWALFVILGLLSACGAPKHHLGPEMVFWNNGIAVGMALPDSFEMMKFIPGFYNNGSISELTFEVSPQSFAQFQEDHSAVALEIRGKKLISSEQLDLNGLQATNVLTEEMDEMAGMIRYEKMAFPVGQGTAIMSAFYTVDNRDTLSSKIHQAFMTLRRIPERDKAPMDGFTFGFTPEQAPALKLTHALGQEMLIYAGAADGACAAADLEVVMRKWPKPSSSIDTTRYELDWIFAYLQSETHSEDGFQGAVWNGNPSRTIYAKSIQAEGMRDVRQTIWFAPDHTYLWFSKIRMSQDSCSNSLWYLVPQMQVK